MSVHLEKGELLSCDWLNEFPLITCGTGAGKTHFTMTRKLAEHIEGATGRKMNFILHLVPTKALRNDILGNKAYRAVELDESDLLQPLADDAIRVGCFARFANFLSDGNEVLNVPDLIVLDECDALISWTLCFEGYSLAFDWILSKRREMLMCGLTATPKLLLEYVNRHTDCNFVDITPDYPVVYKARQIDVIPHSSASTYLKALKADSSHKALVYVRSAKECRRLAKAYGDRAAFYVSQSNINHERQEVDVDAAFGVKRLELADYLTKHNALPPEIDVLIFNDAMCAGFNINDDAVKTVISDSVDISIAIQAKGRVRHDIEKFVFIYNGKEKKPYFRSYDAARKYYTGEWNEIEYLQEGYKDILFYKCGDGYKRNPFAMAIYDYLGDAIHDMNAKKFTEPLASHTDSELNFISADTLAADIRNSSKIPKLDIQKLFSFEDGEISKLVTSKDLENIAKSFRLTDRKGNVLGKKSFVKFVNEHSDYSIASLGKRQINGKRSSYYKIESVQNVGEIS